MARSDERCDPDCVSTVCMFLVFICLIVGWILFPIIHSDFQVINHRLKLLDRQTSLTHQYDCYVLSEQKKTCTTSTATRKSRQAQGSKSSNTEVKNKISVYK